MQMTSILNMHVSKIISINQLLKKFLHLYQFLI